MDIFYFTATEIEAITTALLGFNSNKYSDAMLIENLVEDKNIFKGYSLIHQYNCQGCHIIEDFGGQIADAIGSPEYSPPNLNTQGSKTQPDWLFKFFKNPITIRPNLQVRMPSFTMLDDSDWNSIININLHGTFYCSKFIVPHMIKNNYGRIVNIASVAGKDGNANASAYSSAKAGVIGLTKSLGKELAKYNIAVNAITPAGAKTKILDQMSKEHVKWMLSKVPRGRFLELNELTSMVCWLSSEENSFSTAAVFDISGGRSTY